ncbi:MAG: aminoglycoside phosphotransferase family protein [Parasporobacterium sp.]|nr:aminoglycoside phosphotransferase family protein [Parasporobacterium sp.]
MDNVVRVTEHIVRKTRDPRSTMNVIRTTDGLTYYIDETGRYWRMYDYVENTICFQTAQSPEDFYQCAVIFTQFQNLLSDFPADSLFETIPDFHNTPARFRQLKNALKNDIAHRAADNQDIIDFYLEREERAGELQRMREAEELPLRVTHNDTKLNNVLFDAETGKPVCIVDLDTVMPGLTAYDFGDALRFGAATGAEDEKDLSKVSFDLEMYRIFVRGVLSASRELTEKEIDTIPLAAWTITLETGSRFLADYLNGDVYFGIREPDSNLYRARTQAKLVKDMEDKWDEMIRIINELK